MTMVPPVPPPGAPPPMPTRGAFAVSEVVPLISQASNAKAAAHAAYVTAAQRAADTKAAARKVRADLIVRLRAFGNDTTGVAIKTSAERNEWADADPTVQQAELEADLALEAKRSARMAWEDADAQFQVLRTMLGMERDENAMHAQRS